MPWSPTSCEATALLSAFPLLILGGVPVVRGELAGLEGLRELVEAQTVVAQLVRAIPPLQERIVAVAGVDVIVVRVVGDQGPEQLRVFLGCLSHLVLVNVSTGVVVDSLEQLLSSCSGQAVLSDDLQEVFPRQPTLPVFADFVSVEVIIPELAEAAWVSSCLMIS